jgi:flavodoxin/ferredoxin
MEITSKQRRINEMTKCLMFYYSKGGTTEKVAKSIADGLTSAECTVDLYNIKDSELPSIKGYDLIGVGSPVYYYRPTFNILDTLKSLPDLDGIAYFSFVLYGTYRFDTDTIINKILTSKNAYQVGSYHCYGEDYFLGYLKRGYLFSPNHPTAAEIEEAKVFGREVMKNFKDNTPVNPDNKQKLKFINLVQRFSVNQWLSKNILSKNLKVNRDKCSSCGICVKECPTENIAMDENEYPTWGSNCILCLYCGLICPEEAITSPIDWILFKPFLDYNVQKALQDPDIDNIPIKLNKGQVERI